MTGIIDYAHTETRSFADLPFNEIDALIISTLIYEDVASVCPTLMLDETRLRLVRRTHSRFRTQASTDLAEGYLASRA